MFTLNELNWFFYVVSKILIVTSLSGNQNHSIMEFGPAHKLHYFLDGMIDR